MRFSSQAQMLESPALGPMGNPVVENFQSATAAIAVIASPCVLKSRVLVLKMHASLVLKLYASSVLKLYALYAH